MAELLVRHGASVNVADLWKFTPLHEAAAKGKYEICKLLLKVRISYYTHLCPVLVIDTMMMIRAKRTVRDFRRDINICPE